VTIFEPRYQSSSCFDLVFLVVHGLLFFLHLWYTILLGTVIQAHSLGSGRRSCSFPGDGQGVRLNLHPSCLLKLFLAKAAWRIPHHHILRLIIYIIRRLIHSLADAIGPVVAHITFQPQCSLSVASSAFSGKQYLTINNRASRKTAFVIVFPPSRLLLVSKANRSPSPHRQVRCRKDRL